MPAGSGRQFAQQTPEYWQRVIAINLMGTIHCTKAVIDRMVPRRHGAIVCISSDASFGERRNVVYGAAKGGVNTFVKAIAKEYGRYGIRCNAAAPGVVIPASRTDIGSQSLWAAEGAVFTRSPSRAIQSRRSARQVGTRRGYRPRRSVLQLGGDGRTRPGQIISVSGGYATP